MVTAHIPTVLLVVVLASVVLPALSAAVTRLHWDSSVTGIITALLSAATGFVTELAHAGNDFQWKTAAVTALASWLVALLAQKGVISDTGLESRLLLLGNGSSVSVGEPDPTVGLEPGPLVTGTLAPEQTAPTTTA